MKEGYIIRDQEKSDFSLKVAPQSLPTLRSLPEEEIPQTI